MKTKHGIYRSRARAYSVIAACSGDGAGCNFFASSSPDADEPVAPATVRARVNAHLRDNPTHAVCVHSTREKWWHGKDRSTP